MTTTVQEISLERLDDDTGQASRRTSYGLNNSSQEQLVSDLAPIDGGRQAWIFLLASFIFEMIIWGQANAYGAFQNYHDHDPRSALFQKASPAATSAIGTLAIAGQHFVPLLTKGFFQSYPHLIRRTCVAATTLSSLSLLIASFLEAYVPALIIFQGILYGILAGVTFTPIIMWLPQWFDKRRGMASGIIYSASGLGGTLFPLVFGRLLSNVGFSWTLRIIAFYSLVATSIGLMIMKPRLPIIKPAAGDTRSLLRKLRPEGLMALVGTFAGANEVVIVCQTSAWCTISLQIATYTTSLGFDLATATGVLSAFNASATIGYLLLGRLIDVTSYPYVMAGSTLISSLAAFLLLGFSHSLPLLLSFVLIFGLSGGGFATLMTPVSADLAKMHNQDTSTIHLGLIFIRGVAAVCGPLIGTTLYERSQQTDFALYGTNGFRGLVVYVGAAMTAGCILAMAVANLRRKL